MPDNHCKDFMPARGDDRICGNCFWRSQDGLCEAVHSKYVKPEKRPCCYHTLVGEAEKEGAFKRPGNYLNEESSE